VKFVSKGLFATSGKGEFSRMIKVVVVVDSFSMIVTLSSVSL
jgi:hypothetical protein